MIHRFAEHYQAVFVESKANSTTLAGGELFSQSPTIFITAMRPDELSSSSLVRSAPHFWHNPP